MGAVESNDKERDMSVPDHISQTFKQTNILTEGMETSNSTQDRYGECQVIEATYDKVIIKKRLKIKDERQYQLYLKNRQHRLNFDSNVFVKLIDYESGALPEEETEGNTYKYYIDSYFEHHNNDLAEEIKNRKSNDMYFSASELEQLMDMFIKAGSTLNELGSRHGDLRPEFVCINDSTGKFLLMENVREKTGTGGRLAFVAEVDIYLSPILFKCYSKNVIKYKHDKEKDDVFSAGLIILEAGLLESIQDCYDRERGKFMVEKLSEMIDRFEQSYGNNPKLCQRLKSFLVFDETDRCSFKELSKQTGIVSTPVNPQVSNPYGAGYQSQQTTPGYTSGGFSYAQKPQPQYQPQNTTSYGYPSNNYQQSNPLSYGQPSQPQPTLVYGRSPLQTHNQPQPTTTYGGFSSSPSQPINRFQGGTGNPLASRLGNY